MEQEQSFEEIVELKSRLVHLDLKGAPPSISYLQKILPLLHKWGATGLLVEYEDVFPYDDDLKSLSCSHAYSKKDVAAIQDLASTNGLSVIPLVQTFGHLEFVLKHAKFSYLREMNRFCMALCPSKQESLDLVFAMLDQVMAVHSNAQYFHIGCDEVFHLGLCEDCLKVMTENGWGKDQLFFSHVKKVASYLRNKYPQVTCIVWDDMFRHSEASVISSCDLGGLVEPMVWHYLPTFALPNDLWDKLSATFPKIWIASAFKGATGPRAIVNNIKYYLDNHNAWLSLLPQIAYKFKSIQGITFTGWQRYDHYATMCEFLPTSIPSLVLCMRFVEKRTLDDVHIADISKDLGFTSSLSSNPVRGEPVKCDFPGSNIYSLMSELVNFETSYKEFEMSDYMAVWMNEYNITRQFVNPVHVEPLLSSAMQLLTNARSIETKAQDFLNSEIFFSPGVVLDEWKGVFLLPIVKSLERFVSKARDIISQNS